MRRFGLILMLLGLWGCEAAPVLQQGSLAPSFTLTRLDGSPLRFPEELAGRPLVIRFWADWCPYCRDEMAGLEQLFQTRQGTGLAILAVNVGQERAVVQRFVDSLGLTYPALLDADSAVTRRYGVIALPTTYLVNRAGRIRSKLLGETDQKTMGRLITELLEANP